MPFYFLFFFFFLLFIYYYYLFFFIFIFFLGGGGEGEGRGAGWGRVAIFTYNLFVLCLFTRNCICMSFLSLLIFCFLLVHPIVWIISKLFKWARQRHFLQDYIGAHGRLRLACCSLETWRSAYRRFVALATHKEHCEDPVQTVWLHRVIWIFTERIYNIVEWCAPKGIGSIKPLHVQHCSFRGCILPLAPP